MENCFPSFLRNNKNDIKEIERMRVLTSGNVNSKRFFIRLNKFLKFSKGLGNNFCKLSSKNNLQTIEEARKFWRWKWKSNSFCILACQSALIENFIFTACNQSGKALVAQEETVRISGDGETWEGPEASGWGMRIDFRWALEPDDSLGIARLWQQIRPVASVNFVIVDQSLGAWELMWNSVLTFDVACWTFGAVFVESELILTAGSWNCSR